MVSLTTESHMLALPIWLLGFRLAQLVLSIIILGLTAYGVTFWVFDGISLMIFVAVATMIITVYIIVATVALPIVYNYWAILGLDIFAVVFWLVSFAYLASDVASIKNAYGNTNFGSFDLSSSGLSDSGSGSDCIDGGYFCSRSISNLAARSTTNAQTLYGAMGAASGLGALEFVLFIVTLVFTSLYLHRHRSSGGHCTSDRMRSAGNAGPGYTGDKPEDLRPEPVV